MSLLSGGNHNSPSPSLHPPAQQQRNIVSGITDPLFHNLSSIYSVCLFLKKTNLKMQGCIQKDGGMGFLSVTHSAKPNFLAGRVWDLPNIAEAMSQPNAESVLRMLVPLQNCLQTVVEGLAASGVEDLPTVASALECSGQSTRSHWRLAVSACSVARLTLFSGSPHIGAWLCQHANVSS